jgi:hypothetical protein
MMTRMAQAAGKVAVGVRSTPRALKRERIFNLLTARLKSCPSQNPLESDPKTRPNQNFSARCEVVLFPLLHGDLETLLRAATTTLPRSSE